MADERIEYTRTGRVYKRAVTPGLRKLLFVIALGVSLLGANSCYLAAVSFMGFLRGANYENQFYLYMFLLHLVLGLVLVVPFVVFGLLHMRNTRGRKNRKVLRLGHALFSSCLGVIATGLVMTLRLLPLDSIGGRASYWIHVLLPVVAVLFYIAHRLYGPRIKWRWGAAYATSVLVFAGGMAGMHSQDPRDWNVRGGGAEYFHPSEARTATMGFIPEQSLMMDDYCARCHPEAVEDHYQSVHHFSSFNNPPYLFSVRQSREAMLQRDGNVQGARFCAGCHDPVPFFSGAFDDPDFDDVGHPTAQAGITCTVCHAITDVAGTVGNANYTIEEPLHYPFAYSDNELLQWVNNQLVKAKPAFHKKTFLKPMHETAEFCAVCHKVNLPYELNHYKEWLRGQNHYDSFLLSGVSGHGARSFYYPQVAQPNCNECHMPRKESDDFAAEDGQIHDHRFPGSNTAIPFMKGLKEQVDLQADFLADGQVDVDIFALREGGRIDGRLLGPVGSKNPRLEAGKSYLVEIVIRTLAVGHIYTQGTADSNQVWLELEARQGERVIGRSGSVDHKGFVDSWSHFVNALVLDRRGERIDRRNAEDIFVPLYSNQQPPGTGQVVHYRIEIPEGFAGRFELEVKFNYRKFDQAYMNYVYDDLRRRGEHQGPNPELPIVVQASDRATFQVGASGAETPISNGESASGGTRKPEWQRWRDYGIGLLRKGNSGADKGQLKQAAEAFEQVVAMGRAIGWVDLARVHEKEGDVENARKDLERAVEGGVVATWTVNWLTGLINRQNGAYDEAIAAFESVLDTRVPDRGFDFSRDYQVGVELGKTHVLRARTRRGEERRREYMRAIDRFQAVLAEDAENLAAHYNLITCYREQGMMKEAARHERLHAKYKPDDNARDQAVAAHRAKYPAADHAANAIVIYDLNRDTDR